MVTRHQRRKAALARKLEHGNAAIIQANLSTPQPKRPTSRLAADYARATGWRLDNIADRSLHRNNAVPMKHRTLAIMTTPAREAIVRQRVAPLFRDDMRLVIAKGDLPKAKPARPSERVKGRIKWNLDCFVDNRELRLKK